jgi:predicted dehydrogenase
MLKIAVIGVGHLGKIHLRLWKEISHVQLVGFFDADATIAQQVATEFGVPFFENLNELLGACDAVDIVTPTLSHFEIASAAIKKFKHVFIEKPITRTVNESKKLVALIREANVKGQVGHVERFNPAFTAARDSLTQPMFIEAHRLAEFNPRGTDVSVVHDLMIHDLDIVLSVVKSPIKRLLASGVAVVSDSADIANARIEFHNGCICNLTASRISMKNMRKTRFFQKDAYIAVDFLKKKTEIVKLKHLEGEAGPLDVTIDLGPNKGSKVIYFDLPEVPANNAIRDELQNFTDAILNDQPIIVTIEAAHQALKVAESINDKILQSLNLSSPA